VRIYPGQFELPPEAGQGPLSVEKMCVKESGSLGVRNGSRMTPNDQQITRWSTLLNTIANSVAPQAVHAVFGETLDLFLDPFYPKFSDAQYRDFLHLAALARLIFERAREPEAASIRRTILFVWGGTGLKKNPLHPSGDTLRARRSAAGGNTHRGGEEITHLGRENDQ
jgi:hypothetical protein